MGGTALQAAELRERLSASFQAAGIRFPSRKIVLALSDGAFWSDLHDLPSALAILVGMGKISPERVEEVVSFGRLGLSGSVSGGEDWGIPPEARKLWASREVKFSCGDKKPDGRAFHHLAEVLEWAASGRGGHDFGVLDARPANPESTLVGAPPIVLRAATLSAAGGHSLLLLGPHGFGKTTLGRSLVDLLPPLCAEERRDMSATMGGASLRPFRAPHFRISVAGLVGRAEAGQMGEWQRARHGVLFLDEILERPREKIEPLRTLLEEADSGRPIFVAAANLCPCGRSGASHGGCRCSPRQRDAYLGRLSGAMEDRFDLRLSLFEHPRKAGLNDLEVVRQNVARVRAISRQRAGKWNALLTADEALRVTSWTPPAERLLRDLRGSPRSLAAASRLAVTLSDLDGKSAVEECHVLEALFFRSGELKR